MRRHLLLSLGLAVTCFASCRERNAIDPETKPDSSLISQETVGTTTTTMKSAEPAKSETADPKPAEKEVPKAEPVLPQEPPIVIANQPMNNQRIESLAFAHGNGMCLEVKATGETSLQACNNKANGQKFLFSRSLDGRVQLKDTSSEFCLAVGPASFFSDTYLLGEVCESKASQFFSVVDYGNNYSLKVDGNNTCIDADSSSVAAGTRLILFECSAALNQKIKVQKK